VIRQQVEQDIARDQSQVYDFVVTNYIQNHPRWDPRVVRSELTSPGGIDTGATGVEVRKQMGREMTYNFRVEELTPDHVTLDATGSGASLRAIWAVAPSASGSRLTIDFSLGMKGPMRLFEPLMKGSVRREMQEAAQRIKQLVETR
jgi:hypothetical protein